MGRRNKSYSKDLKQQIYEALTKMLHEGEGKSKREAKKDGSDKNLIFSFSTYKDYRKHCNYFAEYINEKHPECTTLKAARKYVTEWIEYRMEHGGKTGKFLSAWTIALDRQAVGKLFGIDPDDKDFASIPQRKREDIKRSRVDAVRDKHFSKTNNDEFIKFCQGTGCRRQIIGKLIGGDLYTRNELENMISSGNLVKSATRVSGDVDVISLISEALIAFPDQEHFIFHRKDKGGRSRFSPIIGKSKEQIIERMSSIGHEEKVWLHVPDNADIHGYRSDYANTLYKMYARNIDDIPFDMVHARIMAIADVFDAVSSKRCYRDAMPIEKCFQIIEEGSGKDFDPKLVEMFMSARAEIIEYYINNK